MNNLVKSIERKYATRYLIRSKPWYIPLFLWREVISCVVMEDKQTVYVLNAVSTPREYIKIELPGGISVKVAEDNMLDWFDFGFTDVIPEEVI